MSRRPASEVLSVRVPPQLVDRLERHVARVRQDVAAVALSAGVELPEPSQADVLRALLTKALSEAEGGAYTAYTPYTGPTPGPSDDAPSGSDA